MFISVDVAGLGAAAKGAGARQVDLVVREVDLDGADVEVTVRYTKLTYTLTIDLTSITDGTPAGDSIELKLKSGEAYNVTVPATEGFSPMNESVSGVMPASDRRITVFMIPDGENADEIRRNYNSMIIEDYGTPLGVFNSVLGSGELIE